MLLLHCLSLNGAFHILGKRCVLTSSLSFQIPNSLFIDLHFLQPEQDRQKLRGNCIFGLDSQLSFILIIISIFQIVALSGGLTKMVLVTAARDYINRMLQDISGMKVLILDSQTVINFLTYLFFNSLSLIQLLSKINLFNSLICYLFNHLPSNLNNST